MFFGLFYDAYSEIDLVEVIVLDFRLQLQRNIFRLIGTGTAGGFLSDFGQLSKFFFNIKSRENRISLLNLLSVHHFKLEGVFPDNIRIPQTHLFSDFL